MNKQLTATGFRLTQRGIQIGKYMYRTYHNVKRIQKGGPDYLEAAEDFVKDTSEIGVIAIKMSQFLSARSDVIDERTLKVIERFQSDVTPEKEPPPDFIGYEWYPEPIASASIATVYKGKRKADNVDVILKRVRPEVKQRIMEDLPLFIIVLDIAKFFGVAGAENMLEIVRECQPVLLGELNLKLEAKAMSLFKKKFANIPWLTIPTVYEAGETYMVSEYVPSKKITAAYPNELLARRLFELYIYMTIDIGLVHADPHAGNIGIKKDGTFVLYDFGAIIDVRDAKQFIAKCLKSVVLEDTDGVVRSLEEMGVIKAGGSVARLKKAIPKIKKIMESEDFNVELSKLPEFTSNENRIFELTTRYIYLIRSLTIVEGIISYHDRNFSLTKYIKKYDNIIDDIVDVPTIDIVKEIAGDFLTTPASLKNMNDLIFSLKDELSVEMAEAKKLARYGFGMFLLLEVLKML